MPQAVLCAFIIIVNAPASLSQGLIAVGPHPDEYYCRLFGSEHVFCKFSGSNEISPDCGNSHYQFLPRADVEKAVGDSFINQQRSAYAGKSRVPQNHRPTDYTIPNMNLLIWDDELAAMAERLMNQCPGGIYPFNEVDRFKVGQTFMQSTHPGHYEDLASLLVRLFHGPGVKGHEFHVVKEEHGETELISNYNEKFPMSLITNPYFKYYGCAFGKVQKKNPERPGSYTWLYQILLICNFGPLDLPYAKIQPRGKPCSQCPNNTTCLRNSECPNLCQKSHEPDEAEEESMTETISDKTEREGTDYSGTEGGGNVTLFTEGILLEQQSEQITETGVPNNSSVNSCFMTCSNGVPHARCLFKEVSLDYDEVVVVNGREVRESIQVWHNNVRNLVAGGIQGYPMSGNMRELQWNTLLEKSAVAWASQCKPYKHGCQDEYLAEGSDSPTRVTQLVAPFIWDGTKGLPPYTQALHNWLLGAKYFRSEMLQRYVTPKMDADYSSFAQLIWANTYMLGCGIALCHSRIADSNQNETDAKESLLITVCNYAPGGMDDGKSVFEVGGPCSLCTRLHHNNTGGMYCSKEYISLCSVPKGRAWRTRQWDPGGGRDWKGAGKGVVLLPYCY